MNLTLNNGIAEHKDVETTMIYTHVLKEGGSVSEVQRMHFEFLGKRRSYPNRIRQRAVVQDATSAMNKQIGEWRRSFMWKGNEELMPFSGFIQIKIDKISGT